MTRLHSVLGKAPLSSLDLQVAPSFPSNFHFAIWWMTAVWAKMYGKASVVALEVKYQLKRSELHLRLHLEALPRARGRLSFTPSS